MKKVSAGLKLWNYAISGCHKTNCRPFTLRMNVKPCYEWASSPLFHCIVFPPWVTIIFWCGYVRCILLYCRVSQWPRRGFGLVIGFIGYLEVVTTNNYNTIAELHNLQSLHTNLLRLSALVFMYLWHRIYKSLTKSHTPNTTVLQHT
jgi:hypothetical protein